MAYLMNISKLKKMITRILKHKLKLIWICLTKIPCKSFTIIYIQRPSMKRFAEWRYFALILSAEPSHDMYSSL